VEVFVGRQPIFNQMEEVVAYELLYRKNEMNWFEKEDSDSATIQVLKNTVFSIGIDELTNGLPGFINFTEKLLMSDIFDILDPSTFVIEILENVPITENLIYRIMDLKKRGFKIVLDDFVLEQNKEKYNYLFPHIDIIKIDFLNTSKQERTLIEERVKQHFPHIQLLAEKVENRIQFEEAKTANYTLFQGYFFEEPQIIKSSDVPMNTFNYFQVMNILKENNANIQNIAETIEQNVALTYKLLRLINNLSRKKIKVQSIEQAIMGLGLMELRKYLYLLALHEGRLEEPTDVEIELMRTSLIRGKICELLARKKKKENYAEYYLAGMFSLIDAILQKPINEIVAELPFSKEIIDTICGKKTEMTDYLQLSIALSKLEIHLATRLAKALGFEIRDLVDIYKAALEHSKKSF